MSLIDLFEESWHLHAPASTKEIEMVSSRFAIVLPTEYVEILLWSNGGDFRIGDTYLRLWGAREVLESNPGYAVQDFLPGTVAIGSDAGDNLYLLDYRNTGIEPPLLMVDAGTLFFDECARQADSFAAAITAWSGIHTARAQLLGCLQRRPK